MKIAVIGGGNLGSAIVKGLRQARPELEISVSRRNAGLLGELAGLGVTTTADNVRCIEGAEVVILAVKPFQLGAILSQLAPVTGEQAVVSCVANVSLEEMRRELGSAPALFRAMPNTAIARRQSMTCLAHAAAPEARVQQVLALFQLLGDAILIEEKLMDAATVLGACGIGYAMRYIRASMQAGIQIGFDSQTALRIVAQTVKGAASLLQENHSHPEEEIDKVTTPRGCTIVGLNEMEHQGMSSAVIRGIQSSYRAVSELK